MSECAIIYNTGLVPTKKKQFEEQLAALLSAMKQELGADALGDVSILLHDDAALQSLNHQFRGINKPTNVLSFPNDESGYLGDIAISLETIEREADEQDKAPLDHLLHMVAHGMLHLLGHDHGDTADADTMEALEVKLLRNISINNPYDRS